MIGEYIDEENLLASRAAIKEIFFLSSRSGAKLSGIEKDCFFQTWAGYYLDSLPTQTLVFKTNLGKIVGYLTGCYDSVAALDLYKNLFYYRAFETYYSQYPTHFHINCHPNFRNTGIGGALVEAFVQNSAERGVPGVHLVTARSADNRRFYESHEFHLHATKGFGSGDLVLLGRKCGT